MITVLDAVNHNLSYPMLTELQAFMLHVLHVHEIDNFALVRARHEFAYAWTVKTPHQNLSKLCESCKSIK